MHRPRTLQPLRIMTPTAQILRVRRTVMPKAVVVPKRREIRPAASILSLREVRRSIRELGDDFFLV